MNASRTDPQQQFMTVWAMHHEGPMRKVFPGGTAADLFPGGTRGRGKAAAPPREGGRAAAAGPPRRPPSALSSRSGPSPDRAR